MSQVLLYNGYLSLNILMIFSHSLELVFLIYLYFQYIINGRSQKYYSILLERLLSCLTTPPPVAITTLCILLMSELIMLYISKVILAFKKISEILPCICSVLIYVNKRIFSFLKLFTNSCFSTTIIPVKTILLHFLLLPTQATQRNTEDGSFVLFNTRDSSFVL